jgi:hypothetical protein
MRNLHSTLTLFSVACLFTTSAMAQSQSFKPMDQSTTQYQLWADSEFQSEIQGSLGKCSVATTLDTDDSGNQVIDFAMGVPGTDFDLFGYGMSIPLSDFPLHAGYQKTFADPGTPTMILTYDGSKLNFAFAKDDELLDRIYPFTVEIDPFLTKAVSLEASMEGYESTFGTPKKHVTVSCTF